MNLAHMLDPLADESFVPYRDAYGNIRLRDLSTPSPGKSTPEKDAMRRRLLDGFKRTAKAAVQVETEDQWRAWFDRHMVPLSELICEALHVLGGCCGDEGREWHDLWDSLADAVRRDGWRFEQSNKD
jgi:hypothetical protein